MNNETSSEEIWKPVKGFRGLYEVSNLGRVRSIDWEESIKNRWGTITTRKHKGKLLKPRVRTKGYLGVQLGAGNEIQIHRLVLEVFVRPPKKGECCNHIDCNKTNNNINNLEWVSYRENMLHARENNLLVSTKGKTWSKFTLEEVHEIRAQYGKAKTKQLAKKYGVTCSAISRVGLRQTFKNI